MEHGTCPNCEKKVIFEKEPEFGLHVLCETCQTESVITWLNPIELELIDNEDFQTDEEFEEFEQFEEFEEYENNQQYGKFADEEEVETFQKIKKRNKGGYNGSRQTQEN